MNQFPALATMTTADLILSEADDTKRLAELPAHRPHDREVYLARRAAIHAELERRNSDHGISPAGCCTANPRRYL